LLRTPKGDGKARFSEGVVWENETLYVSDGEPICGIAGEVHWIAPANRSGVDAMIRGIAHRAPDARGVWSSATGACVLGHPRLSVVDLSAAANQPMVDPLTGNAIAFQRRDLQLSVTAEAVRGGG
jgi:hypothetical protein